MHSSTTCCDDLSWLAPFVGRYTPPYTWEGMSAYLGLATPGESGSWQKESKVRFNFVHNANVPNSFTYNPNRKPTFEWYMVKCDSKNGYKKDVCLKKIELHDQNMITILNSIVHISVGTHMTI